MMMIRVVLCSSLLTLLTLRGNLKLNPVALRKHIRLKFDNYASKMKIIANYLSEYIYYICYVTLQSENMIKIKFSENKSYIIKEIWMRINFTAFFHTRCVILCYLLWKLFENFVIKDVLLNQWGLGMEIYLRISNMVFYTYQTKSLEII